MKVVQREFSQEIDVAAAVALWNYWDGEHLTVVHQGYTAARVLHEDKRLGVSLLEFRVPLLSFLKSHGLSTVLLTEELPDGGAEFKNFNLGLLSIPSVTTIRVTSLGPDRCRIEMRYRFFLRWPFSLFAPVLHELMAKWNHQVWLEDLPLKLRRQKVLRHGFQDFVGMPDRVSERRNDAPLRVKMPVPRPPGSPLDDMRQDR